MSEAAAGAATEARFAATVDGLAGDPGRRGELLALLSETHPCYEQRGAASVARMRGWALLALARHGLPDDGLLFVLEELETGIDPYLVGAAARALRASSAPDAAFAPPLMRALGHVRYRDEPLSFDAYGEYGAGPSTTSALRELLAALEWLGPRARGVLEELAALRAGPVGLARRLSPDLDRAVAAIGGEHVAAVPPAVAADGDCCSPSRRVRRVVSRPIGRRRDSRTIEATLFEDHDGATVTFGELFFGRPSIVVFFYTRCDNPLKCSSTIARLARVQELLRERGAGDAVATAAITYDPGYDLPARLHAYGRARGLRLDPRHRMLRAVDGMDALRGHFELGVNFVGSLINRHRIEASLLDRQGRIATTYERLPWSEEELVERSLELLEEEEKEEEETAPPPRRRAAALSLGGVASLGAALFPKCPLCWSSYLSMLGVAGVERIPYAPWLLPLLAVGVLVNLGSLALRARSTGRWGGCLAAAAGAALLAASKLDLAGQEIGFAGVALVLAGSLASAFGGGSPVGWRDPQEETR